MRVALSRGAVLAGPDHGGWPISLTAPISDLIGLRRDHEYTLHLEKTYVPLWPTSWLEGISEERVEPPDLGLAILIATTERIDEQVQSWRSRGLPKLFLHAAHRAREGRFSSRLGRYYERIVRHPAECVDEVPDADLPALAAWALDQALRLGPLEVRKCPLCKVPWLAAADQKSPLCARPYPGRQMSCRALKKDEHFQESQRKRRLEYKRLHERKRRGAMSEADWEAWRSENSPEAWVRFEVWKERQIPSGARSSEDARRA